VIGPRDRLSETNGALAPGAERIRPHVIDTGSYLRRGLKEGATLLAEGAHGAMLDLSSRTYVCSRRPSERRR